MKRERATSINIRISGEEACFTDPAFTGERFSYPIPTPVGLEGTLKAVYWRKNPTPLRWNIHSIALLAPIKRTCDRRNELQKFGPITPSTEDAFTQRLTTYLKDVDYLVEASIGLEGEFQNPSEIAKGHDMALRYLEQGKQFHQPYLGCRECPANVRLAQPDDPKPIDMDHDFGRMVFGYVWEGERRAQILEYRAVMVRGVVRVPSYAEVHRLAAKVAS